MQQRRRIYNKTWRETYHAHMIQKWLTMHGKTDKSGKKKVSSTVEHFENDEYA